MADNRQALRSFVSSGIAFAFVLLGISGIALYFAPSCRLARLTGWEFLFLDKETWETLHMTFALLFLIGGSFHLFLNWNIFLIYMKGKKSEAKLRNRPFIFAAVIALFFLLMAFFSVAPVSWMGDYHETIKRGKAAGSYEQRMPRRERRGRFRRYRRNLPEGQ